MKCKDCMSAGRCVDPESQETFLLCLKTKDLIQGSLSINIKSNAPSWCPNRSSNEDIRM